MSKDSCAIAVFEVNYLGDFVCMMPTIAGLRKMLPEARITLITSYIGEELIRHSGLVDEVLPFEFNQYHRLFMHPIKLWELVSRLRKQRFTASISAHDECTMTALLAREARIPIRIGFRSRAKGSRLYTHCLEFDPNLHVIENRFKVLEVLAKQLCLKASLPALSRVPIKYTEREEKVVLRVFESLGCEKVVVIHPFAKRPYQEWPLYRFLEVARQIVLNSSQMGCIVISGGRDIRVPSHPRITCVKETTLLELAAFLDKADVFVGNNSGPMHMAIAQGTKTVWISGPSQVYWDGFWRETYIKKISAGVACQPCDKIWYPANECKNSIAPMVCMESVKVEELVAAVMEAIGKK